MTWMKVESDVQIFARLNKFNALRLATLIVY